MTTVVELRIEPYFDKLVLHFSTQVDHKSDSYLPLKQSFWQWLETEWHAVRVQQRDTVTKSDLIRFPDEETALHFRLRWG